jgi:hypothetical protein
MYVKPDENNNSFTARIEGAIALLADENNTDWWTARVRQRDGEIARLQGPDVSPWRRKWATNTRRRVSLPAVRKKRWPFV